MMKMGNSGAAPAKKGLRVDVEVGARVRDRRRALGLSQTALAEAVGVTFQQIQKYERGANRMGASRLQQIGDALKVPPAFFFDGKTTAFNPLRHPEDQILEFFSTLEGEALIRSFKRIKSQGIRRDIVRLVQKLTE